MTDRDDLRDALAGSIQAIVFHIFHRQRDRAFGVDVETEAHLVRRWDALVKSDPGSALIDAFLDEWETVTSITRRRRALYEVLSGMVDSADARRLDTLEQMVEVLSVAPPILTPEMDEAVLAAQRAVDTGVEILTDALVLRLPPEDWCNITGIKFSLHGEPSGWRQGSSTASGDELPPRSLNDAITREEFINRASSSVILDWPKPLLDEISEPF